MATTMYACICFNNLTAQKIKPKNKAHIDIKLKIARKAHF